MISTVQQPAETEPALTFPRCTGMGLSARQGRGRGGFDLVDEWADLRTRGATYREIGAAYGFSHERVRQVLGPLELPDPAVIRRQRKAAEIGAWLTEHGPVTLGELTAVLDIDERQLMYYAKKVPGAIPLHLVILNARPTVAQYSDAELMTALREVWDRLSHNRRTAGLSHSRYDRYRRSDQPSSALMINRLGGWEKACQAAGLPSGQWTRPKHTYASKWSDDDLLDIVAEYASQAAASRTKPSYLGYERYQLERGDLPSGSTVRNRLKTIGLATWPAVLDGALRRTVPA